MKRIVLVVVMVFVCGSFAWADQQILDDLIVDGSACVGQDCVNGESFGFDTIRLKENNLRIRFYDTSNTASFPSNDWQITVNDSANGGANKFSIDDIDGGRTPFTIEASAPTNSLYVDAGGKIGLGTSTPVVDVHIKSGNTPTLRLEQDGSSGFSPQTWDVAGNEANFFIRDVTNGSALPFRIIPGAPSNSIFTASNGDVGIGTTSPDAALHVQRNGEARIFLDNTSSLINPWSLSHRNNGDFIISLSASGQAEVVVETDGDLKAYGDVYAQGVMLTSDVNTKGDITPVDKQMVLARLSDLPMSTWSRKADESGTRHLGPMAQDFHKAFGLGRDERHISPLDVAGVALVGVQELQERVKAKDVRIAELEARIAALEALIKSLASKD